MFTRYALSGLIIFLALALSGLGQAWAVDAQLVAPISLKQMKIASGPIKYNKATRTSELKLNFTYLTKNKKDLMTGPLGVVISNITTPGAQLVNASGNTASGAYIQILNSGAQLKKNQKIKNVVLRFSNPTGKKLKFKKAVYRIVVSPVLPPPPPVSPDAPISDAGSDQTVKAGSLVTLNGSKSKAIKGNLVSFQWQQKTDPAVATPVVAIIKNGIAQPTFYAPLDAKASVLDFELVVEDSNGIKSAPSKVRVNVLAVPPPTVHAGIHQLVEAGSTAILDGTQSFSEGGDLKSYLWTLVSGAPVTLKDAGKAQASFTVPAESVNTDYVFQLTVTDAWDRTASENMTVSVQKPFEIHLNDTGMITCGDYAQAFSNIYDNGLDCNGTDPENDPIPLGQDALFGRDFQSRTGVLVKVGGGFGGFDFTKIDVNGSALPASASSWACVRDNHTKLIWEVKTIDNGLHDMNGTYSWYDPDNSVNGGSVGKPKGGKCNGAVDCDTLSYIAAVNAEKLCGKNDWRLPSVLELLGIVNQNQEAAKPAIDTDYFPNTQIVGEYWTKTPLASDYTYAKTVNFNDGTQDYALKSLNDGKKVGIRLVTKAP